MSRRLSLALTIAALGLAACEQTVSLNDRATGGSSTGGVTGTGGGASGGGASGSGPNKDAGVEGRCFGSPSPIAFTADLPQIVVALDRSSAMGASFGMTDQLHAALNAIQADVSRYGGGRNVRLSIQFSFLDFPDTASDCNATLGCCSSDVKTNYTDFQSSSTCSTSPGSTSCIQSSNRPTAAALTEAYTYFMSGSGSSRSGERYVLLVSDDDPYGCSTGDPCSDAINAVTKLTGIGVTTEVVAIGGGAGCLDDLATAQSVFPAPYVVATSPTDLPNVIDAVAAAVAQSGCRLTLSSAPSSGTLLVTFGGVKQSEDTGTTGNGWGTDGNTRVFLHGTLCQMFLQSNSNSSFGGLQISDDVCGSGQGSPNP